MLHMKIPVAQDVSQTARWGGRKPAALACAALVLISFVLFLLNIHQGIGIFTDSTRYMGISAQEYDAPVYHWMLMLGQGAGLTLTATATLIAELALVANVVLIFALLRKATCDWRYAMAGTALIVLLPQFVTLHSSAMSEPPFLTFLLATIWAALSWFENGSRRMLVGCSVLLGLATLTRFSAPPLGAALALIIMLDPRRTVRRRLEYSALLAAVGGALFFAWVIVSNMTVGRSIGRQLWFYGTMGPAEWWSSLEMMTVWILPAAVPIAIRLPLLAFLIGFAAWQVVPQFRLLRSAHAEQDIATGQSLSTGTWLQLILSLFFLFYMGFMVLSTAIEANLTLTSRYAFPACVALVMLLTLQVHALGQSALDQSALGQSALGKPGLIWIGLVLLGGIVVVSHVTRTATRTAEVFRHGYGYQSIGWRSSPTIAAARDLPTDVQIYSNGPDIIAYLADRKALFIPQVTMLRTNLPEPGNPVSLQIDRLRVRAQEGPVYLVMFDKVDWRFYLATEAALVKALKLSAPQRFSDGRIYRIDGARP